MSTTKKRNAAGPADKSLSVAARHPNGFYRAGRRWGAEATIVPLSELSAEEADALRHEPMLVVTEVDVQAATA